MKGIKEIYSEDRLDAIADIKEVFEKIKDRVGFFSTQILYIEGKKVKVPVRNKEGRKLYSLNEIADRLEIEVRHLKEKIVKVKQGDHIIYYLMGEKIVSNESGCFKLDMAPISINKKTYVPLGSICTMFGYCMEKRKNKIHIERIYNFIKPVTTGVSHIFINDRLLIEEMLFIVRVDLYYEFFKEYIDQIKEGDQADYQNASTEYKKYLSSDKLYTRWLSVDIDSQEGQEVYNIIKSFLDEVEAIFLCIEKEDIEGADHKIRKLKKQIRQMKKAERALVRKTYEVADTIKN